MLALSVPETGVKNFMNKLLKEDTFDAFECRSAVITTFARFEITSEKPSYCLWEIIRPHALSIVKSGGKPRTMKFVFALSGGETEAKFPHASALFLNILFDSGRIILTTGTAEKTLSFQKDLDRQWGEFIVNRLIANGITVESA